MVNGDEGTLTQIAEKDLDHAERKIEVRCEISYRDGQ
jgi:hypothetical protein